MTCVADNRVAAAANTAPLSVVTALSNGQRALSKKASNDAQVVVTETSPVSSVSLKPEQYIAFQLHCIPEQRGVYLHLEKDVYHINVYVDSRDLALNRRIFEREQNMMNYYRHQFKFDLSVLPLNGRTIDEMNPKGTKVL